MPQPDTDLNSDGDCEQPRNEAQKGLATNTTVAHIYCACRHKSDWKAEARQNGYSSMSSYLYDLILEAQSYLREGFLSREDSVEHWITLPYCHRGIRFRYALMSRILLQDISDAFKPKYNKGQ